MTPPGAYVMFNNIPRVGDARRFSTLVRMTAARAELLAQELPGRFVEPESRPAALTRGCTPHSPFFREGGLPTLGPTTVAPRRPGRVPRMARMQGASRSSLARRCFSRSSVPTAAVGRAIHGQAQREVQGARAEKATAAALVTSGREDPAPSSFMTRAPVIPTQPASSLKCASYPRCPPSSCSWIDQGACSHPIQRR